MKLLKQKILFLLYFVQSFSVFAGLKKEKKYLSYNFLYSLLPEFVQAAIRKATGELVKKGEIDKIIRNRKVFLRLTVLGEKRLRNLFSNFFAQTLKAKGWFLGVVRDQGDVRRIRKNLEELGFVRLKRGVYLLPANRDFAKSLEKVFGEVLFIFTHKLEFFDEQQLVGRLWNLDRFYKESQDFVIQAQKLLNKVGKKKILSQREKKSIAALSNNFFILIKNTIRMPKNLLPSDWPLPKAAVIFNKILERVE